MGITIQLPDGQMREFNRDRITIGRGPGCEIQLVGDSSVRDRHARIRKLAGRWLIESLGDWPIQAGGSVPARLCWLGIADTIRLAQNGPELVFEPAHEDVVLDSVVPKAKLVPTESPAPSSAPSPDRDCSTPFPGEPIRRPVPRPFPKSAGSPRSIPMPLPDQPTEQRSTPLPLSDKWNEKGSGPLPVPDWFYSNNGTEYGPVTAQELKSLADQGILTPSDLISRAGRSGKRPANQVKGLFDDQSIGSLNPILQIQTMPEPTDNLKRRPVGSRAVVIGFFSLALVMGLLFVRNLSWSERKTATNLPANTNPAGVSNPVNQPLSTRPVASSKAATNPPSNVSPVTASGPAVTGPAESWDLEKVIDFRQPYGGGIVCLLPNNSFAYCANDFHLRICDISTNKEMIVLRDMEPPPYGVRMSPTAHCILWGSGLSPKTGTTLFAWNYLDQRIQMRLQVQTPQEKWPYVTEGVYSPDQQLIATAALSRDKPSEAPVRIWDAVTLKKVSEIDGKGPVVFSPDGSLLAFGDSKNRGCTLWDLKARTKLDDLKRAESNSNAGYVKLLAFIPNTPFLAVVSSESDHIIEIWNTQTHKISTVLESRSSGVRLSISSLAASHDGSFLVTGGKQVRVWHLPSGGRMSVLMECKDWITSVSISEDGNRIAAASEGKKVAFWMRRADLTGQFRYGAPAKPYSGDPQVVNLRGPNGEQVRVGGDGLGTDSFYHYYLDKDGKQIKHGPSRERLNGTGRQESNYDRGVLISRSDYDSKLKLQASYKRLNDGSYEKDEDIRTLPDGTVSVVRSIVTIVITETTETIKEIQRRHKVFQPSQVAANNAPLPPVSGRKLKVNVDTAGKENMATRWIQNQNESLSSVNCVATEDQLVFDFDINSSRWTKMGKSFPLLIRLFDKNGEYLTHFTTAEGFTVFVDTYDESETIHERFTQARASDEAAKWKCVLLKPKGNRFVYGLNIRDLRDAAIVEIGFTERR